jgi:hypothetical protein
MGICVLCGSSIDAQLMPNGSVWVHGHNACPVKEGRCCSSCNSEVVLPARLANLLMWARGDRDSWPEEENG